MPGPWLSSVLLGSLRWGGDGAVTELTESVLIEFTNTLETGMSAEAHQFVSGNGCCVTSGLSILSHKKKNLDVT